MEFLQIFLNDLDFILSNYPISFFIFLLANIITWLILRIFTDYKFLWCKHNCEKCGCWTCKFYHEKSDN